MPGDGQGRDTDEGGTEHLPLNDVDEMDENEDVQVMPFKRTEDIDRVADMGSNLNYEQDGNKFHTAAARRYKRGVVAVADNAKAGISIFNLGFRQPIFVSLENLESSTKSIIYDEEVVRFVSGRSCRFACRGTSGVVRDGEGKAIALVIVEPLLPSKYVPGVKFVHAGDIIYFQNNFRPFKMQVKESYTDVGSNRDATDDADREDKMDINLVVQGPSRIYLEGLTSVLAKLQPVGNHISSSAFTKEDVFLVNEESETCPQGVFVLNRLVTPVDKEAKLVRLILRLGDGMEKATIPNGLSIARASRITRAQQLNHALRINWQSYTLVSACFKKLVAKSKAFKSKAATAAQRSPPPPVDHRERIQLQQRAKEEPPCERHNPVMRQSIRPSDVWDNGRPAPNLPPRLSALVHNQQPRDVNDNTWQRPKSKLSDLVMDQAAYLNSVKRQGGGGDVRAYPAVERPSSCPANERLNRRRPPIGQYSAGSLDNWQPQESAVFPARDDRQGWHAKDDRQPTDSLRRRATGLPKPVHLAAKQRLEDDVKLNKNNESQQEASYSTSTRSEGHCAKTRELGDIYSSHSDENNRETQGTKQEQRDSRLLEANGHQKRDIRASPTDSEPGRKHSKQEYETDGSVDGRREGGRRKGDMEGLRRQGRDGSAGRRHGGDGSLGVGQGRHGSLGRGQERNGPLGRGQVRDKSADSGQNMMDRSAERGHKEDVLPNEVVESKRLVAEERMLIEKEIRELEERKRKLVELRAQSGYSAAYLTGDYLTTEAVTAYSTEPYSTEPYSSAATSTATTYSTEAYSTVAASAAAAYATEPPAAGHFGGYINRSSDDDLFIRQDKLTDSERSIIDHYCPFPSDRSPTAAVTYRHGQRHLN